MTNSWVDADRATDYLARADALPHRGEGEGVLVRDLAGAHPGRILDLGCGDGRLTALVLAAFPSATAVCVDMSPTMLDAISDRWLRVCSVAYSDLRNARSQSVSPEGAACSEPSNRVRMVLNSPAPGTGSICARPTIVT